MSLKKKKKNHTWYFLKNNIRFKDTKFLFMVYKIKAEIKFLEKRFKHFFFFFEKRFKHIYTPLK